MNQGRGQHVEKLDKKGKIKKIQRLLAVESIAQATANVHNSRMEPSRKNFSTSGPAPSFI
jgi:hypothetical protein